MLRQIIRRLHQNTFNQLTQRHFNRRFKTFIHANHFADALRTSDALRVQPTHDAAGLLTQRRVLQSLQRRETTAGGLVLLASCIQAILQFALCFLQLRDRCLTLINIRADAVRRRFELRVLAGQFFDGSSQLGEIKQFAFGCQAVVATFCLENLALQVFDRRSFNVRSTRRICRGFVELLPLLLPILHRQFSNAQRFLLFYVALAQNFELRLIATHRFGQRIKTRLIITQVRNNFGQLRFRFRTCAGQTIREFTLVFDLLFNACQLTAHFVARGLLRIQCGGGFFALHAMRFNFALGFTHFRNDLLEFGFGRCEFLAMRRELCIQTAMFQRLVLRILDLAIGL